MSKIFIFLIYFCTEILSQLISVPPLEYPTSEIQAGTLIISNNNPASTTTIVNDKATVTFNYLTAFTTVPMTGTAIIHY
jgi:hypothetical protein